MSKQSEENEIRFDRLLNIRTTGIDRSNSDQYRYPYEPTPYCVLERLANSGWIGKVNTLIDYGCGKGRVDFFLSYQTRCHSIGVEYDERIFAKAEENREVAVSSERVEFILANAENYMVPERVDRFFFYYPSNEYISYLMTVDELQFWDEIDCRDLFSGDEPRERIVVFELEERWQNVL